MFIVESLCEQVIIAEVEMEIIKIWMLEQVI